MKDMNVNIAARIEPTPSNSEELDQRFSDFSSLIEALEYAAKGKAGINFYSAKGELERVCTYAELQSEAMNLARHLLSFDLKRGDRVGIIADMSMDFIVGFFACQYAGLLAVPLPVVTGLGGRKGYEAQLERVIDTAGTKIVLGSEATLESLKQACAGKDILMIGQIDDVLQKPQSSENLLPLKPEEASHIQYSSGSTRNPLGILISQKSLMANALSVARDGLKFRKGDRVASWLPFYHDMGLIGFLLIPITSQLSIDLLHTDSFARRPLKWLEIISNNRCTMAFSPTFGYEICSRRGFGKDDLDLDLSCWRAAGIGGDMVQPSVMDEFYNCFGRYGFRKEAFVPSYGLAEMTLAFSFSPLEEGVLSDLIDKETLNTLQQARPANENSAADKVRNFALCGKPMPGYDLEIRDENGKAMQERCEGLVFIKGPALMDSYYNNPEATRLVMSDDGWLNTGDRGYLVDGALVITGRQKDLMIINGRNIWPQDLEWHVEDQIDTLKKRDVAAFSVEQDDKEKIVVLVHCRTREQDKQAELKKQVQSAVLTRAGAECRAVLIAPGSLPYTTSGKLSRAKAKKDYLEGHIQDISGIGN